MERLEIANMEIALVQRMNGFIDISDYEHYEQLKYLEIEPGEIGVIVRGTRITKVILIGE